MDHVTEMYQTTHVVGRADEWNTFTVITFRERTMYVLKFKKNNKINFYRNDIN